MPTLLLRLTGPMQSWGTTSRFNQRDTGKEPSKSGVLGLLAAAMGIDRANWTDLEPLTRLSMGVRHDRPGMLKSDYQTAGAAAGDTIIKAGGSQSKDGVVSKRYYLADACFLVALEGPDKVLLEKAHNALKNPAWPLALGRKSYVPSESIWMENAVLDLPLMAALESWPWTSSLRKWEKPPDKLLVSMESTDGSGLMKMDQPLSSFAERRFGARFVASQWIPFPQGGPSCI
ncbi:CRISPR-associated protein, Cas5e family [Desulfatibacillum alkenivorans DSM 16219]|jgi:CRISPR system Cascade subunit CasD|uniref:CRISPR-associated protein, Cas5e family n=1 Tax=Desulfatibacillum alkenivorans DSM 16219 TaxID=1121393 RepID=A0A1M6YAN9_9BACT|nr:type I-E CRISPR-associated protein Cas5/CasD [Desulfatibacillum alkenivorans]SHL15278.1 CRISPR-associated protein, Cas5e family [Desulfatibacillum alkenivorans DSM 16219]